jgi:CheY-like chemotaxis protein
MQIKNLSPRRGVLVVEDVPIVRLAAVALAEEHGFDVHEAADADEAIAILEQEAGIAIVFTDIHMAGSMDGLALAAYARNRWPPLKFIIVSGDHSPCAEDMPAGAQFFAKPYDERAVAKAVVSAGLTLPC